MTPETGAEELEQDLLLSEADVALRKLFLELDGNDEARLKGINEIANRYAEPVIDAFYDHLMKFEETAAYFRDPRVLAHVKKKQKEYFLRLTQGNYDMEYVNNRIKIGKVHEKISLPMRSYLGMYSYYLRAVAARLVECEQLGPQEAVEAFLSMIKLTFLDIGLAIDTYIYARERTIVRQQEAIVQQEAIREAIRELSTPVLQIRDRLLILPIIGVIDSQRAKQLTDSLLQAIRANRAKVVVMDITGVAAVDSRVANHLIQTVAAARLMGAIVIITGLSADVAQALVALGVDLAEITTVGDLQGGLEEAERLLGYRVVRLDDESRPDRQT